MVFEYGALTVGGISILTIIVSKLKFCVKKNGSLPARREGSTLLPPQTHFLPLGPQKYGSHDATVG